jgi:hypothetical protein
MLGLLIVTRLDRLARSTRDHDRALPSSVINWQRRRRMAQKRRHRAVEFVRYAVHGIDENRGGLPFLIRENGRT